jgi:hypothetical protein
MPRDIGTGLYHYPDGTPGNPGQTIFSTRYNTFINDLTNTLNQALPINMGGTGADNPTTARDNLDAEVSRQIVTNFDTHVFEFGSLYAGLATTGAPRSDRSYSGFAHGFDNSNLDIEVRDMNDPVAPGTRYTRQKRGGVWSQWYQGNYHNADQAIVKTNPALILDKTATSGQIANVLGSTLGLPRWQLVLGNATAESPTAVGSDFSLNAYNNAGALISTPLTIRRSDGVASFATPPYASGYNFTNGGTVQSVGNASILLSPSGAGAIAAGSSGVLANLYDNNQHQFRMANGTSGTDVQVLGNLGIGVSGNSSPGETTATGISIQSQGTLRISKSSSYAMVWNLNSDGVLVYINRSAGSCGSIGVNTTSTSFNTSSDERLKEDLKSFDAGNIVDDTNVYDFAWKATGARSYGVIAQQANTVYPAAVAYDPEKDWWGIDYSKYVPVILQELKALRARVAELESKLEGKPS